MKEIILSILILNSLFSRWKEISKDIKGEKILEKENVYFIISSEKDARLEIKNSKSVKIEIQNKGEENKFFVYKNGKKYKEYKIKDKKEIKLFLRKGNYSFKTEKGTLYIRFFEWKKENLKQITPVGGGYTLTLSIRDKKYTYYRVTEDTTCTFKIEGPETLHLYARGDFGKDGKRIYEIFKIKVFDGEKEIFSGEFKGKASKKSNYMEKYDIIPSEAEKFEIPIKGGIHEIKIMFEKGKGAIKVYLKKNKKYSKQILK